MAIFIFCVSIVSVFAIAMHRVIIMAYYTPTYRNYNSKIKYSIADKKYYGYCINETDIITFEGITLYEAHQMFYAAVDNYIEMKKRLKNKGRC